MARNTLVGTVHREKGLCNENELLRILETISPDVIFEEIRPSDFYSFYKDKTKSILETRTVGRYIKTHPTQQVPVDGYVMPEGFFKDIEVLFDYVELNSDEYIELVDEREQKTFDLGYRYINSLEFEYLSKRCRHSFETTIALSGRDDLINIFAAWNHQLRQRENSMLENIYGFCRKTQFTNGVFLVGAEHLPSIIKGIERFKAEANLSEWNVWSRA